MKISCPACAAKYSIADEKVHDRLAKIRCRKCGTTIVIDGKVQPVHIYAADGSSPAHSDPVPEAGAGEYSVDLGDNDQRTMTLHDLIEAYNAGQVTAETYLWTEGMADWKPLGEFPEIVEALHQAASQPAVASAAPAAAAPSPWEGAAAPQPARAAARDTRRAGSTDLFGSFETAGSESDLMAGAHDAGPSPGATGARNESSVLFSLSALTSAAQKPAPMTASKPTASAPAAGASGSATREDSGLIDLKALTAAAKPETEQPMIQPSPLGAAPLGFAPPLGMAAPLGAGVESHIGDISYPQKSRTGIYVIGTAIVLAATVIVVALILRPQPPAPEALQPTVAAPAPAPTPEPTPTAAIEAKPPTTGTAGEEGAPDGGKVATARKRPRRSGGGSTKAPSGGAAAPAGGGDTPAPKPAASKSPCGCASGDLQCAMRCAAK